MGGGEQESATVDVMALGGWKDAATLLTCYQHTTCRMLCEEIGLEYRQVKSREGERVREGIYHIQNVNALHALHGELHAPAYLPR